MLYPIEISIRKKFNINVTYHIKKEVKNLFDKEETLKAIIEDINSFESPLRH